MKHKNKLIFTIIASFFTLFLLSGSFVRAEKFSYPVKDLENCRDMKECSLYCEIPANKPSCWAYGEYVLKNNVLGEETAKITFPVFELGNCASAIECKEFCEKEENKKACRVFASNHNLGKYKQQQGFIKQAQAELGCTTVDECKILCSDPVNRQKCMAFGKKVKPQEQQKKEQEEIQDKLIKAKEILGCQSIAECRSMCEDPANQEKCKQLIASGSAKMRPVLKNGVTCNTQSECYRVCQENPEKCPSFKRPQEQAKEASRPAGLPPQQLNQR